MAELTDAQKVLRNDTGKRIAAAIEALGGTPPISLGMTGATPGQVPVINTVDANGAPTSYRPGAGGGGGTEDALPLAGGTMEGAINMDGNKVSNLPTPTANGDAVNKSYVDGQLANYRTSAAQDAIDAAQNTEIVARAQANEVGIVITGKRPSMAVTAGQYVIVRNSTISGISDGLYTANSALSPSTDVTAANLTAVSGGGLNSLQNNVFQYTEYTLTKLSTANNWTIIRSHACRLGKIAFLQIVASVTAAQDSSGVRIIELPQDLWPRYGVETRVTSAEFAMDVNVNITVEGNMAFTRGGSTAGNIRMDFCYPTN